MARRWWRRAGSVPAADGPARGERRRRWLRRILLPLGPALVALVAGWFYLTGGRYVDTDDAYLEADMVAVSAEVSGPSSRSRCARTSKSRRDSSSCSRSTGSRSSAQAEARLQQAANQVDSLKAIYRQKQQQLELARHNTAYAEQEFQRQAELLQRDFASRARYDAVQHDLDVARQQQAMLSRSCACRGRRRRSRSTPIPAAHGTAAVDSIAQATGARVLGAAGAERVRQLGQGRAAHPGPARARAPARTTRRCAPA